VIPLLLTLALSARADDAEPTIPPLPPRPVQAGVGADECPELDLPGPVPPACRGIVLPVTVWAHLEDLAVDSREVRARHAIDVLQMGLYRDQWRDRYGWTRAALDDEQRRHRRDLWLVGGGAVAVALGVGWAVTSSYRAGLEAGLGVDR